MREMDIPPKTRSKIVKEESKWENINGYFLKNLVKVKESRNNAQQFILQEYC